MPTDGEISEPSEGEGGVVTLGWSDTLTVLAEDHRDVSVLAGLR